MARYLDHSNIQTFKKLFHQKTSQQIISMTTLTVRNEPINKFPTVNTFQIFRNIENMTFKNCSLTSIPTHLIRKVMKNLKYIDLSDNNFSSISIFEPLGSLKKLQDLNLLNNPFTFINSRIFQIRSLLFPKHKIRYKLTSCLIANYNPSPRVISKANSEKRLLVIRKKPALVPRSGHFPMLKTLNNEQISEDEYMTAKPYSSQALLFKPPDLSYRDPILTKVRKKNKKLLADRVKYGPDMSKKMRNCLKKPALECVPKVFVLKDTLISTTAPQGLENIDDSCLNQSFQSSRQTLQIPLDQDKEQSRFLPQKTLRFTQIIQKPQQITSPNLQKLRKQNFTSILPQREPEKKEKLQQVDFHQQRRLSNRLDLRNIIQHQKKVQNKVLQPLKSPVHQKSPTKQMNEQEKGVSSQSLATIEASLQKLQTKKFELKERKYRLEADEKKLSDRRKDPIEFKPVHREIFLQKGPFLLPDQEKIVIDFKSLIDAPYIRRGSTVVVEPILRFEQMVDQLGSQLKQKELEFKVLSQQNSNKKFRMRKNLAQRHAMNQKLKYILDQAQRLKFEFQYNQEQFFSRYEQKPDLHQLLLKEDFLDIELPSFVISPKNQ